MSEQAAYKSLKTEIDHEHFVRAAFLAASLDLSEEEVQDLRFKAVWQSALNRNDQGTKVLAKQYGFSKEKVREILEQHLQEIKQEGKSKLLGLRYNLSLGKHLSFEEWMEYCLKNWERT